METYTLHLLDIVPDLIERVRKMLAINDDIDAAIFSPEFRPNRIMFGDRMTNNHHIEGEVNFNDGLVARVVEHRSTSWTDASFAEYDRTFTLYKNDALVGTSHLHQSDIGVYSLRQTKLSDEDYLLMKNHLGGLMGMKGPLRAMSTKNNFITYALDLGIANVGFKLYHTAFGSWSRELVKQDAEPDNLCRYTVEQQRIINVVYEENTLDQTRLRLLTD